jgi:hypothetical protein
LALVYFLKGGKYFYLNIRIFKTYPYIWINKHVESMTINKKVSRGSIRTIEFDRAALSWWFSMPKGRRVVLCNMAGLTINGKCILSYEQIQQNANAAYVCYEKFA